MVFESMKFKVYAFTFLMLVCNGCLYDERRKETYSKKWTIDVNQYLGLDAKAGKTYGAIVDGSRLLVSHNTGATASLLEIDYDNGTVTHQISIDKDSVQLVKSGERVLLLHEQKDTKTYTLGLYDPINDAQINFLPTLRGPDLSPDGGQQIGLVTSPVETIYTYGSIPDDDGVPMLWIANWDYNGSHQWTTIVNDHVPGTLDPSTVDVQLVTETNLVFTVETENEGHKNVTLMSVNGYDGNINWFKATSNNLPIRHVVENFGPESVYAFYSMGYSTLGYYGEETFTNPMQEFANGTLVTKPLVVHSLKMFLAVHEGDDLTLVNSRDQVTRWTGKYWEKTTQPLILLSTEISDAVLVVSSNGFITKYSQDQ
jgi:hypothetical protein